MISTEVKYPKTDPAQFFKILRTRVNDYFKQKQISRKGTQKSLVKGGISLTILLMPYAMILSMNLPEWFMLILCVVMGIGMSLVGANVMHEACHGAFSPNRWINSIAANTMYLLGGDKLVWQTSHNVLHHSYTNIYGHDVDLEAGNGILRFTKHAEWKPKHRYQHIYAFFLYSLLTFTWVFLTDFIKLRKFTRKGITFQSQTNPVKNWARLIFFKLCNYTFWLVIPILVLDLAFWKIFLGLFVMHLVSGIALTLVFQLAHLTGITDMPIPDEAGNMENTWAIHQLYTTANWATDNPIANWSCGGLNFQIEHHLFPAMSHIHYPEIAPIVKETAREFGLPYYEYGTVGEALGAHYQHLWEMGRG